MDILQRMPWVTQDAVFKRLSEIAEVASLDKEERQQYDESLRHYRDTIAVMEGQYLEGEANVNVNGTTTNQRRQQTTCLLPTQSILPGFIRFLTSSFACLTVLPKTNS